MLVSRSLFLRVDFMLKRTGTSKISTKVTLFKGSQATPCHCLYWMVVQINRYYAAHLSVMMVSFIYFTVLYWILRLLDKSKGYRHDELHCVPLLTISSPQAIAISVWIAKKSCNQINILHWEAVYVDLPHRNMISLYNKLSAAKAIWDNNQIEDSLTTFFWLHFTLWVTVN